MNAGKLKERIEIQQESKVKDPLTGDLTNFGYASLGFFWSEVKQASAREVFQFSGIENEIKYKITIRSSVFKSPVSVKNRVIWRNQILNIEGVIDSTPPTFQELYCSLEGSV